MTGMGMGAARAVGLALVSSFALGGAGFAGGPTAMAVDGKEVGAWTLDPATGKVYASLSGESVVIELDPTTGAETRRFPAGGKGEALAVKGKRLLVAHREANLLVGIDLDKGEKAFSIKLSWGEDGRAAQPVLLAAPEGQDPWVFALAPEEGQQHYGKSLLQIDTRAGKVARKIPLRQAGVSRPHAERATISSDGTLILLDAECVVSIDAETGLLTQRAQNHQHGGGWASAGPHGRFWVVGQRLISADLSTKVKEESGWPFTLHPLRDLLVSTVRQDQWNTRGKVSLKLSRYSSGTELTTIHLGGNDRDYSDRGRRQDQPLLVVDAARERAFWAWGDRAWVVDLSSVDAPPLFLLRAPSVATVDLGQTLSVELGFTHPKAGEGAKLSLVDPPAGASISGKKLTWKPSGEQVGQHRLVITAEKGEQQDQVSIAVDVVRPHLALDFPIRWLAIDEQGKRALASDMGGDRFAHRDGDVAVQLALIDLEKNAVQARRTLAKSVRALALGADAAFMVPQQGNMIYRLKLADLSDASRAFVQGQVTQLDVLPGGKLAALQERQQVSILDPTSLEQVAQVTGDGWNHVVGVTRLREGAVVGNRLIGADGSLRGLVGFIPGAPVLGMSFDQRGDDRGPARRLWNRDAGPHGLSSPTQGQIASWQGGAAQLLTRAPAALVVRVQQDPARRNQYNQSVVLEVRDLIEGNVKSSLGIAVLVPTERENALTLASGGTRVLVGVGNRLHPVSLPEEALRGLPEPLEVWATQEGPLALQHTGKPVEVAFAASGGSGARKFELEHEVDGMQLDAASGKVTLDPARLWKGFAELARKQGQYLDEKQANAAYAAVFGSNPAGCPVSVLVSLAVIDAENQRARAKAVVVLVGPWAEVKPEVKVARRPEVEQPQPRREAPAGLDPTLLAGLQRELAAGQEETRQQLAELEQRIAALGQPTGESDASLARARRAEESLTRLAGRLDGVEAREAKARAWQPLTLATQGGAGLLVALIAFALGRASRSRPAPAAEARQAPTPPPAPPDEPQKRPSEEKARRKKARTEKHAANEIEERAVEDPAPAEEKAVDEKPIEPTPVDERSLAATPPPPAVPDGFEAVESDAALTPVAKPEPKKKATDPLRREKKRSDERAALKRRKGSDERPVTRAKKPEPETADSAHG